jgi:hypothetical protein
MISFDVLEMKRLDQIRQFDVFECPPKRTADDLRITADRARGLKLAASWCGIAFCKSDRTFERIDNLCD